jgi:hypothetical protein
MHATSEITIFYIRSPLETLYTELRKIINLSLVLYGHETFSPTLKEESRSTVPENDANDILTLERKKSLENYKIVTT